MKPLSTFLLLVWLAWSGAAIPGYAQQFSVSSNGALALAPGGSVSLYGPGGYNSYRWTRNNVDLVGTQQSLLVSSAGYYRVEVSNGGVPQVSQAARVTVRAGAGSPDKNYTQEDVVLQAGVVAESTIDQAQTKKSRSITYADGLLRPVQQVEVKASPAGRDIVQFSEYDANGQQPRQYLSYTGGSDGLFKADPAGDQRAFYNGTAKVVPESNGLTYSEAIFEDTPSGGVIEQGAPGSSWQIAKDGTGQSTFQGHTQRTLTRTNTANEFPVWTYTPGPDGAISSATYAWSPAQTLSVSQGADEDNRTLSAYTNSLGLTVGKRITLEGGQFSYTASAYDALGRTLMEITPEGVDQVLRQGQQPTAAFLEKWAYFYQYDARGRTVGKKVPGRGWTYFVYDPWDRLVATQNANQRVGAASQWRWNYVKYDELNRPIIMGTFADGRSRQQLSDAVAAGVAAGTFGRYESKALTTTTTLTLGYTRTKTFPISPPSNFINTVSYYDTYDFLDQDSRLSRLRYQAEAATIIASPSAPSQRIADRPTIQVTRILDATTWLTTATYYDEEGRVIQTQQQNHRGGVDRQTMEYETFTGKVLRTLLVHTIVQAPAQPTAATHSVRYRYVYDDTNASGGRKEFGADRVSKVYALFDHVNGNTQEVLLSASEYNELDQLVDSKLGEFEPGKYLQSVDYRYHLRGWLDKINNRGIAGPHYDPQTQTVTGDPVWMGSHTPNEDADARADLFGLELTYEEGGAGGTGGYYNGNITSAIWNSRSPNLGKMRAYQYTYDRQNQLSAAKFSAFGMNTTTWQWDWQQEQNDTEGKGRFTTDGIQYDLNGNIRFLNRVGHRSTANGQPSYGSIDRLAYTYDGNQLRTVEDGAGATAAPNDFENKVTLSQEYTYDGNGNATSDANKGITIAYNELDLPSRIDFDQGRGSFLFTYTSAGEKLTQEFRPATGASTTADYISGFLYKQGEPLTVVTPTGRALFEPARWQPDKWVQEYHLRDNLGNLRVALRAGGSDLLASATMEQANSQQEEQQFAQLAETRQYDPAHARTGSYAARLNAGQRQRMVGPATDVQVKAGDSLRIEVFGRYAVRRRGKVTPLLLPLAVMSETGAVPRASEGQPALRRRWLPRVGAGIAIAWSALPQLLHPGGNQPPRASVRYDLYNKDSVLVHSEVKYLDEAAQEDWQQLVLGFRAGEEGYAQVSLQNATRDDVWFDDLSVVATEDLIVQENHYDPWGQNLVNLELAGEPSEQRQYTGKERISSLGLELTDYGARYYDAQLGRWHSTDPATQYSSPYVAMGNNSVITIDPDGRFAFVPILIGAAIGAYMGNKAGQAAGASGWGMAGYMLGGAVIGGLSGGFANGVASSGMAFAKTAGIFAGSFTNSVAMNMLSGGQTSVSFSLGVASYNMNKSQFNYLGKKGNSSLQNAGYSLGALVNLSDAVNTVDSFTNWSAKWEAQYKKHIDNGSGDLDTKSLHRNIFKANYPGPKNPFGKNIDPITRQPIPWYGDAPGSSFVDWPSSFHDQTYDILKIAGFKGLTRATEAIPADLRFIGQQLYLGTKYLTTQPLHSVQAYGAGIGLGLLATPKILFNSLLR